MTVLILLFLLVVCLSWVIEPFRSKKQNIEHHTYVDNRTHVHVEVSDSFNSHPSERGSNHGTQKESSGEYADIFQNRTGKRW